LLRDYTLTLPLVESMRVPLISVLASGGEGVYERYTAAVFAHTFLLMGALRIKCGLALSIRV
jgi:hypothetical protein